MNRNSTTVLFLLGFVLLPLLPSGRALRADERDAAQQGASESAREPDDRCPFAPEDGDDNARPPSESAKVPASPKPRITIGRETTFLSGPLTDDGYVDYRAALNEKLSEGVTPENNAAVLLWQCSGPKEIAETNREEFFKLLGIDSLPEEGDYFVTLADFASSEEGGRADALRLQMLDDSVSRAMREPWKREDFPTLASWLDVNEEPLKLAIEASKRARYYQPIAVPDPPFLVYVPLTGPHQGREIARALLARAMLRLADGQHDAAWQDVLVVHRLARLASQTWRAPEALHAAGLNQLACAATVRILERAELTADEARAIEATLRKLPPFEPMVEKMDMGERLMTLEAILGMARYGPKGYRDLIGARVDEGDLLSPITDRLAVSSIDWDRSLKVINVWCDRIVGDARQPTFAERDEALEKSKTALNHLRDSRTNPLTILGLVRARGSESGATAGRLIGATMAGEVLTTVTILPMIEDRQWCMVETARVAAALAAYKADHKAYPGRLDELPPKYIPEMPLDRFTGEALTYKKTEDGYLLYSFGPNRKDDGGLDVRASWPNYDIVVRMPAGD